MRYSGEPLSFQFFSEHDLASPVLQALERVLGAYIKDLDQQSLKLAVWRGEVHRDHPSIPSVSAVNPCGVRLHRSPSTAYS